MKGVKGFKKGHKHSEDTKRKIGLKNSRVMIKFNCDYCKIECESHKSHYILKKRHFCSTNCYALYRKEIMPREEQQRYKGMTTYESHRKYVKNNPERIKHLKARRYARKKNAKGSHTLEQWQALKRIFNYKCGYCELSEKLTKDHIIPLSKGGSDYIGNIQPLCRSCNSKKHNKLNIHENKDLLE